MDEPSKPATWLETQAEQAFNKADTAFSRETKWTMLERAGHVSEHSGRADRPLEASHINHYFADKGHEMYDHPDNGKILTDLEHLAFHIAAHEQPNAIGMTKSTNKFAVDSLKQRVERFNKKFGIDTLEVQVELDNLITEMRQEIFAGVEG